MQAPNQPLQTHETESAVNSSVGPNVLDSIAMTKKTASVDVEQQINDEGLVFRAFNNKSQLYP